MSMDDVAARRMELANKINANIANTKSAEERMRRAEGAMSHMATQEGALNEVHGGRDAKLREAYTALHERVCLPDLSPDDRTATMAEVNKTLAEIAENKIAWQKALDTLVSDNQRAKSELGTARSQLQRLNEEYGQLQAQLAKLLPTDLLVKPAPARAASA
jgi:chromosome segregation ATPase